MLAEWVAGGSCSQWEQGWSPLTGAQAEPCEVGGSVGGLRVQRDLGELTGMVLFSLGRSLPGNKHFRPSGHGT